MQLIYNGVDIIDDIDLRGAELLDRAGGKPDRLTIRFTDSYTEWPRFGTGFGDTLRILESELDSGTMYVDQLTRKSGEFNVSAISLPYEARDGHHQSWEQVTLAQLAGEFAGRYGLTLKTYDMPDVTYARLKQSGEPDLEWLSYRCMLESCALKVFDGGMVIYYEPAMEARQAVKEIDLVGVTGPEYQCNAVYACRSCTVTGANVSGSFSSNIKGRALDINDIAVESVGEAERYARGIARANNKLVHRMTVPLKQDFTFAAGAVVDVAAEGALLSGLWFVDTVIQNMTGESTILALRRPLEGY